MYWRLENKLNKLFLSNCNRLNMCISGNFDFSKLIDWLHLRPSVSRFLGLNARSASPNSVLCFNRELIDVYAFFFNELLFVFIIIIYDLSDFLLRVMWNIVSWSNYILQHRCPNILFRIQTVGYYYLFHSQPISLLTIHFYFIHKRS